MAKTSFKSVSEYIESHPKPMQAMLKRVRAAIRKAVPEANEGISYQMPVYKLNDRIVICFAGWKEHYSLYPAGDRLVEALGTNLTRYKRSKSTIRIPLSEPVPVDLIASIARFRAKEVIEHGKPASSARKKGKSRGPETERR